MTSCISPKEAMRFGKTICFSHHIAAKTLEKIILDDIREMAQRIVLDEKLSVRTLYGITLNLQTKR